MSFIEKMDAAREWLKSHDKENEYLEVIGGFGFEKAEEIIDTRTQQSILKLMRDVMETIKQSK